MRIVVSGADGFLGSHVLERLRKEGNHQVVGLTLFPEALGQRFDGWDGLTVVPADLRIMADSPELADADVYLACAFPRATGAEGMAEGLDFVYGSLGLLLDRGCKAVINVSSQSVYDPHRTSPAKETDPVLLTSIYAATKYCVELSVARACGDMDVPYANVRLASLIGPGFDQRFVNKMVKSALHKHSITVQENGNKYAFLDVEDAAEGLASLLDASYLHEGVSTINLGVSGSYSISHIARQVAESIQESEGQRVEITMGSIIDAVPCTSSELDCKAFYELIGWMPRRKIEQTVASIVSYELNKPFIVN